MPSFVGENFLDREIFDEIQSHPLIAGDSSWGTRNILHALILSMRPAVVVEVGAQIGAASLVIGSALRANRFGKSYHLEPNEEYYAVLKDFISRAGLNDFAFPMQMRSADPVVAALVDHETDLVFLDANHDYSKAYEDLTLCDVILSDRGVVLIDDAGSTHSVEMCGERRGGVRQALIDFVGVRPEFSVIFCEPPLWLNPCGLAIMARKPADEYAQIPSEFLAP